jgi:hypothetical protein
MGKLICTSIEQAKLELGLEGRLFDHNFKTVGHLLTECWIKTVWKETSEYGIHIVERTASLQTECKGDGLLMEEFMQNGYKGKDLRELNKCRLFLQCKTLADIANGKGDKFPTTAIHCLCSPRMNGRSNQPQINYKSYYGEKRCTHASQDTGDLWS